MQRQDYAQLTLFQGDFPANLFPLPGSSEARQTTVTSGRKCAESCGSCTPLGYAVRMCLTSKIWRSTRCLLTWKEKATKQQRCIYQLAVSVPGTDEKESQSWDTEKEWHEMHEKQFARLIPTPTASAARGAAKSRYFGGENYHCRLDELAELTPWGVCGRLNPAWVEWLMGFPIGWTDLDA